MKIEDFKLKAVLYLLPILVVALFFPKTSSAAIVITTSSVRDGISSGLVGHWTFDGRDCGATYCIDKSGSGNTGTLTNDPTNAVGKIGQGLKMLNTSYVAVGTAVSNDTSGTITAWILPTSFSTQKAIYVAENASFHFFGLSLLTDGKLRPQCNNCTGGTNHTDSVGALTLNQWNHVAVTSSGTQWTTYINGVATGDTVTLGNNVGDWFGDVSSTKNHRIGYLAGAGNYINDATVDDVRVYDRALSATEIASLYKYGGTPNATVNSTTRPDPISTTGLVGHWTFDGKDCGATYCVDKSGNDNIATKGLGNIGRPGKIGQGADIASTTGNVFDFGEPAELVTNLEEMTVSLWVKMDETESQNIFLSWSRGNAFGSGQQEIYLDVDTRTGQHLVRYSGSVDGTGCTGATAANTFPTDQRWHHVVIVKSATATEPGGYPVFYIDNKNYAITESCTNSKWYAPGNVALSSLDENKIGALTRSAGNIGIMNGSIDDLRIYNRQLSVAEIAQLYNHGTERLQINSTDHINKTLTSGLVGHWTFDGKDCGATYCIDKSGSGNTGTLVGGVSKVVGRVGQGLSFDGADDKVAATVSGTQAVTYWYKLTNGSWTFNASSTNTTYVNGQADTLSEDTVLIEGTTVEIGNTGSVASPTYFSGLVDDVRIYNRVLSATEITELYNLTK
ncbi:MAG: hypothetical protein COV10_01710 [Candidatus Vogelbacteria bacterium CG10_big_fil_rev_8_21_14_0_10_51_16]|uniref:LamG-like jellyroll fold domain-containing protein n=1 Tax=Candidatus Vogelbacteria bacterium CG10_big_fil_rev_8_21_14_0_10_51_16 TaxID=1975045 RepID=A0A2H0RF03_9BACT|nr:MAG: hypothetical protein COV10_01710 [Candidatus Vogelbacteria bacterium CG10_big_fil_rev_8_21_14_0_10_51_16]